MTSHKHGLAPKSILSRRIALGTSEMVSGKAQCFLAVGEEKKKLFEVTSFNCVLSAE